MNTTLRCPGQDRRFWQLKDIVEVKCPYCTSTIEFWKDDPMRYCSDCGEIINNPQLNLSCAKWCAMAKECLGEIPEEALSASPVIERLKALLHKQLEEEPKRMQNALNTLLRAETMIIKEKGDPLLIKPAALLTGALISRAGNGDQGLSTPPGDAVKWNRILQQAGMEEVGLRDTIITLVEMVLVGDQQETEEYAIVWDATQLQRLENLNPNDSPDMITSAILDSIQTDCGRQMAKRFRP